MLRLANEDDLDYLLKARRDSKLNIRSQIRDGRLRVIDENSQPVGFFKFHVLWDELPYIEMIWLEESSRGQGLGSRAVQDWEREMAAQGFNLTITSTQLDGEAEQFWKQLGYLDCGLLSLPNRAPEHFLQRQLG